jgi:hypothetical protein
MTGAPFVPEWAWDGTFVCIGALLAGGIAWFLEKCRLKWEAERSRKRIAVALDAELELLFAGVLAALQLKDRDPLAAMTTIAALRHVMIVFLGNTDKLGDFETDLARDLIRAYQNIHHLIDRGREMWQEVEREHDASLRDVTIRRVRKDAADWVPRVEAWLEDIPPLRKRLMGTPSARPPGAPPSRA